MAKLKPLYVIMFDSGDDSLASEDCLNPLRTLEAAKRVRDGMGDLKRRNYYIVRYLPQRVVAGKPRPLAARMKGDR